MPVLLAKESDVDVLVIGAGPAGLMAASSLAKAGVNVRIIDQRPNKVAAGQADGLQPRTLEVFQSYGLLHHFEEQGNQLHMVAFYNPSSKGGVERTGRVQAINASTARYPFEITLHQGAIEAIFLDFLASFGVQVERPVIPTSMQLSADEKELKDPQSHPVKVTLQNLDAKSGQPDTEIVHAKYVIGADGAHSWVRKALGISMEGEQSDYIWGVLDMVPETDFPDIRNKSAIHSNNGSCMVIPREGDKIRLYIQLTDTDAVNPLTGRVDKEKMSAEKLLQVAKKSFYPYTIQPKEVEWWTIYGIGQRVASKFSANERVFIAGDACHTHSPKGGQGMNASMIDTHNLTWKIAHVLRGWADMSLLKTYEYERRKYAQDLIYFDKTFSALFSEKPASEENQGGVTHEQFLEAFLSFGLFTSGIGIHYAPSAIVNTKHQSHASNLIIGQRILPSVFIRAADARPFEIQDLIPSDARFKVLVFAGDITEVSQMRRLRVLGEKLGKPEHFYNKFGGKEPSAAFDLITISSSKKEQVDATDFPEVFRPHLNNILLDDEDMHARVAKGTGYDTYGIDRARGAVVVVRPDGYVGMVAPFEDVADIDQYFSSFMTV
ncbi:hypothetical protein PHLCEN_2v12778 [Hermanssonia centrifuga]|uniref:Phenol 2-monooxygenase n=1 Tax=Hermanssonia centrifuga TaxID=98765 RepID=A0A2R6NGA4_9APHY|nr:hypothetical protein PHLCEN_2v12778 [Hermanssonia centrifuga]